MTTGDVTTFHNGSAWTYSVEGDQPLGHAFDTKEPAVAGGRFLAQQNASVHIIMDERGSVVEKHSYAEGPQPRD